MEVLSVEAYLLKEGNCFELKDKQNWYPSTNHSMKEKSNLEMHLYCIK